VLGLFAYVGLKLQPSMQRIVRGINNLKFASAAIDDVHADLVLVEREAPDLAEESPPPLPFEREVLVEGVSFAYEGTDRPALKDVDLRIGAGEAIGICGPTGGGKTTLADLITGLLTPTSGRVIVDGVDIREHVRAWHSNLGVVPQMVFLVDDSLRRNIALGLPDKEIDEEAVSEAVHLAQLDEVVAALPQGLDTVVGERGVRISGGQRQRVSIARALYRQPKVLILDEGTAALDNSTEQKLMEALERLRGDHTIILIAHRLSTVRRCDRIVYVDEGRIAGTDTYDGLIRENTAFRRMSSSA
jgi:ABC-type multidrug transport system fused ATPase/permease subunit